MGLGYKNMALFRKLEHTTLDPYLDHKVESLKDTVANISNVEMENLKDLLHQVSATNDKQEKELNAIKAKIEEVEQRVTKNENDLQKYDQQLLHHDEQFEQQQKQIDHLANRFKEHDIQEIQHRRLQEGNLLIYKYLTL